jgi:LEA14-like dessication related protein
VNRRRWVAAAAVSAVVLAGWSCATMTRAVFSQPVVALRDVRLSAVSFSGGTLDVLLAVYNPNEFNLDASQMTYSVLVDSALVGSGATDQRVVVPAKDSAVVRLPVQFTWNGAGAAGRQLMTNGSVIYQVRGQMKIASGMGTITLPYDQRGRFRSLANPR